MYVCSVQTRIRFTADIYSFATQYAFNGLPATSGRSNFATIHRLIADALGGERPRIAAFLTVQRRQYFVRSEGKVLCEVPALQNALFYIFAAYYNFNLAYPKDYEKLLSYKTTLPMAPRLGRSLLLQTLNIMSNFIVIYNHV